MPQISEANCKFAFSLYCAAAKEQQGNLALAPLSFSLAFALLLNGADEAARQEILHTLGYTGTELTAVNEQTRDLQSALDKTNQSNSEAFLLANSIWATLPQAFTSEFVETARRYYNSDVFAVAADEFSQKVAQWSREKTRGLVDMQLAPADFALLSAAYFKGRWEHPFDEAATQPHDFHPETLPARQVPMMVQKGEYSYYDGNHFHVVALLFSFAQMYFLLPKPGLFSRPSIREIEQKVLRDGWIMTQPFAWRPGLVKIPRFELRHGGEFIPVLRKLGLARVFGSFDSLRQAVTNPEGAKVVRVLQNSAISVDEQGAEAASVLAVVMAAGSAPVWKPPKPFEFVADHPFCFWVVDNLTGSILFMGRVGEP